MWTFREHGRRPVDDAGDLVRVGTDDCGGRRFNSLHEDSSAGEAGLSPTYCSRSAPTTLRRAAPTAGRKPPIAPMTSASTVP